MISKLNRWYLKQGLGLQVIVLSLYWVLIYACALPPTPPQTSQMYLKVFDNSEDYVKEGVNQYKVKNYEVAVTYFQKALEIDPQFQPAHAWLGVTYVYLGRREEALQEFEKVIEIDSTTGDAENARFWIEKLRKPPVIAVAEFETTDYRMGNIGRRVSDMLLNKLFESGLYKTVSYTEFGGWQRLNVNDMCRVAMKKEANILILGIINKLTASADSFLRSRYTNNKPLFKRGTAEVSISLQVYSTKSCELLDTFVESASQGIYQEGDISDSEVRSEAGRQVLNFIFDKFINELHKIVL